MRRLVLAVDHVTAEGGNLKVADRLGRRGARLHELAGHARQPHYRDTGGVGQHGRHLQDHLQALADRGRRVLMERLRAVAGLQTEGLTDGNLSKRFPQAAGLPRKYERRLRANLLHDLVGKLTARPIRLLRRGELAPRGGLPGRHLLVRY
jgi:hypothetical protein